MQRTSENKSSSSTFNPCFPIWMVCVCLEMSSPQRTGGLTCKLDQGRPGIIHSFVFLFWPYIQYLFFEKCWERRTSSTLQGSCPEFCIWIKILWSLGYRAPYLCSSLRGFSLSCWRSSPGQPEPFPGSFFSETGEIDSITLWCWCWGIRNIEPGRHIYYQVEKANLSDLSWHAERNRKDRDGTKILAEFSPTF